MTLIDASLLTTALLFSIYGLFCAIECGIGLALLFPKLAANSKEVNKLFTPLWEVTNVFLVFGFTALGILFNNALQDLSHTLASILIVGLLALVIRACSVLYLFYVAADTNIRRWLIGLFTLTTFLIPASFSAAGAYLLTGMNFWHSLAGCLILIATIAGLTANGLLFINRQEKFKSPSAQLAQQIFLLWIVILGSSLTLALGHSKSLQSVSLIALSAICLLGLLIFIVLNFVRHRNLPWFLSALISLSAPLLLAWANHPYLINKKMLLADAFGAKSFGSIVLIGLAVLMPIIIFGFWLFWGLLFGAQPKTKN